MAGQNHHFAHYAPETIPYAIDRYVQARPRGSTACSTSGSPTASSSPANYSIADMACYPWIVPRAAGAGHRSDFPHLERWYDAIARVPRCSAPTRIAKRVNPQPQPPTGEQERKILFGQDRTSVR